MSTKNAVPALARGSFRSPRSLRIGIACAAAAAVTLAASPAEAGVVGDWNLIAVNCTQGIAGPAGYAGRRAGPPGLLDIALVHAAMHDAVQSIEGRFESYHYDDAGRRGLGSPAAAAATAAFEVLKGLYGAATPCLAGVVDPAVSYGGDPGRVAGLGAAAALLPLARPTLPAPPFQPGTEPGDWQLTPGVAAPQNEFMAQTVPFTLLTPRQFRPHAPPPLISETYRRDYDEVKIMGAAVNSGRTPEQTDMARFWSGNIPAMWNAAVRGVANSQALATGDAARLFALVSMAAADGQITVYETKYHFDFWRPITAIRNGDADGNPRTDGDPTWNSLLPSPAYPDYTSGANCLTASVTTILQLFFGTDELGFAVPSSLQNLTTNPRTFQRFSAAQEEVVEARMLMGIHFRFADEVGRQQGVRVARWAYQKFLRPVH